MQASNVLAQLATPSQQDSAKKRGELGQDDFMRLLVTQLENQDPTNPMDNFEFLSQVAQFGMVNGIQESQQSLNALLESFFSNRTLQATHLVGRKVIADTGIAQLTQGGQIEGAIDLPVAASTVEVQVSDASGQLVRTLQLGPMDAGRQAFSWDGLDQNGEAVPAGPYQVTGRAVIAGETQAVPAYAATTVQSVSVAAGGGDIVLNLDNGASISADSVREFY